ncbi:MAG: protein disulfide oxidoreductase [Chromatiaceae bacterium]
MTDSNREQSGNPTRRGRVRGWLLNLLLILLVLGGVQWWKSRPMASGEAPSLKALSLDGRPLDLADLRGQPVLVHFWATWCPVCRLENGAIDAIARDHRVVTVALQSGDAAEIRDFMTAEGLSFEVLPDQTGAMASQWGVPGVPATFILDPAGRIAFSTPGISSEWGLRARLWAADRMD